MVVTTRNQFWWRWVAANSLAELLGLGTVAALGYVIVGNVGEPRGISQAFDNVDTSRDKIPPRIRVYDRDDQLVEDYGYENLDLGAPLADADFDPKNPAHRF